MNKYKRKNKVREDCQRDCPDFLLPKTTREKRECKPIVKECKPIVKEDVIQKQANDIYELKGIPYLRMGSELYSVIFSNPQLPIGVKKKISDEIKGWPDNMLFLPITPKFNLNCHIELKTETGKLNKGQNDKSKVMSVNIARDYKAIQAIAEKFIWFADKLRADLKPFIEKYGL